MSFKEISGQQLELDHDCHLKNFSDWNEEIAKEIAKEEGIELTGKHWEVIKYTRKEYENTGEPPSLRKINKSGSATTKEMYSLFPNGPGKKYSKIAGLPKPKGCV